MSALYQAIAEHVRQQIADGRLKPGDQLPGEHDLAAMFNVHRDRVREAYDALRREGLIETEHGVGSFVRDPRPWVNISSHYLSRPRNQPRATWLTEAGKQGRDADLRDLTTAFIPASSEIATALGIEPGDSALYRRRVLFVDEVPVQIAYSWFPADLARGTRLTEPEPIWEGVLYILEDVLGLDLAPFTESVTAREPTPDEAAELELGPGTPVLVVDRPTTTTEGRVVQFDRNVCARMRLTYTIPAKTV